MSISGITLKAKFPMILRGLPVNLHSVGRAKDAIKSCVNLPVGQRYSEAWKTLSKNFGQPHMVADAHMKSISS